MLADEGLTATKEVREGLTPLGVITRSHITGVDRLDLQWRRARLADRGIDSEAFALLETQARTRLTQGRVT